MNTSIERSKGILRGHCLDCGDVLHVPDKGIGRANLAAWKTRHQHTPTTTHAEDTEATTTEETL